VLTINAVEHHCESSLRYMYESALAELAEGDEKLETTRRKNRYSVGGTPPKVINFGDGINLESRVLISSHTDEIGRRHVAPSLPSSVSSWHNSIKGNRNTKSVMDVVNVTSKASPSTAKARHTFRFFSFSTSLGKQIFKTTWRNVEFRMSMDGKWQKWRKIGAHGSY